MTIPFANLFSQMHQSPHDHPLAWRADIDGLRAVAVSLVVLFHAFPLQCKGGYFGVDIFFVISGFLISSILLKHLNRGDFSFLNFYERRVRRIFPALGIVLCACFVLGWFSLSSQEFIQLGKGMLGGASFVSNFVLWHESGYFDATSEAKPLLHLWSLAIEEQFYVVWPLILWGLWRYKSLFLIMIALVVASFVSGVVTIHYDNVAAFYSPIARFWELLSGALLAYIFVIKDQQWRHRFFLFHLNNNFAQLSKELLSLLGALLFVVALIFLNKKSAFPGWWALLPVIGAIFIIAAGPQALLNKVVLSNKLMVWLGAISYPLYLWHWPLLSYLYILEGGDPSGVHRLYALMLAIFLAWLTYKFIEQPVRRHGGKTISLAALTLMLVIGIVGGITLVKNGYPERSIAKATQFLAAAQKENTLVVEPIFAKRNPHFQALEFQGRNEGKVLFLGDSLMAHYYSRIEMLYADRDHKPYFSALFAPRSGCRPVPNGESINSNGRDCDEFYHAALELAKQPDVKKIVFSASWQLIFSEHAFGIFGATFEHDLRVLKALHKDVYFISMAPHGRILDPFVIAEKIRLNTIFNHNTQASGDLLLARSEYDFMSTAEGQRMKDFAINLDIPIIDPFDFMCKVDSCYYFQNGEPLYRDQYHLRSDFVRTSATWIDGLIFNK